MSLVGVWNMESSDNFDEYMKAIGVGFATRKMAGVIKPTVKIEENADAGEWVIKVESTFKSSVINFKDGVEFEETTLDGRACKSVITFDGPNKAVQVQKDGKTGVTATTITREVNTEGKLVQTLVCGDVTAVRTYVRQP